MHELGHQLGLLHGGPRIDKLTGATILDSTINCKPNYISAMSYSRQIPGTNLLSLGEFVAGYSNGNMPPLNENSLSEQNGLSSTEDTVVVYGTVKSPTIRKASTYDGSIGESAVKINWDGDGVYDSSNVSVDINNLGFSGCGASPGQTYSDHNDWENLNFNFRGANGQAYDGTKGDPKKIADYTPEIEEQIDSTQLYYTGTFDPVNPQGTSSFKLGSTIPVKFQLWSCNPSLDTEAATCVDVDGIFGPQETLTCISDSDDPSYDPDCKEIPLQIMPNEMIFLLVTKTSDSVVNDGAILDVSGEQGSNGYFVWKDDHYQFNWDTSKLLGNVKGKQKKDSPVGGEYSLLIILLQDGGQKLLIDHENEFFIPSNIDRVAPFGIIDNDAGFPVSMKLSLVS